VSPPDSNFEDFIDNWQKLFRGRLVVFLGAGASIGARNKSDQSLLNAYELRNSLWEAFKWSDTGRPFDPAELRLMSLEHAAAIIEAKTGRTALADYLVERFFCTRPLWQHLVLPYLEPVSLFTTNYDELVEHGYKSYAGKILDIICEDRAPMPGWTPLYKPHGSLSHANQPIGKGGLVITQFDYLEMIVQYRSMLRRAMKDFDTACVLLVGYSFGDMDIGAELYSIRKQNDGIPWYAVFPRDDPQVRKMYSNRFRIEHINRTFESFLAEFDDRVGFIPEDLKHSRIGDLRSRGQIQ
jgi:hypothetical protein